MGVFSINESHFNLGGLPEVEMNENYSTGTDMAIALVEARENEFAVLQAGIKQDAMAAMCEDWDERLAINEATASGLLGKVKEILKKLLEKLKGIFHAFMAKMHSFFMDANAFYKKYSAEIGKKNLRDFKIKAREFHRDRLDNLFSFNSTAPTKGLFASFDKTDTRFDNDDFVEKMMDKDGINEIVLQQIFYNKALSAMSIDDDFGNIAKEIEDYVFEDAEEHDNLSGATIITSSWIGSLLNEKKFISNIEKVNRSSEKAIADMIKNLDKQSVKIAGTIGTDKEFTSQSHAITLSIDPNNKSKYENEYTGEDGRKITGPKSKIKDQEATRMLKQVAWNQTFFTSFQEAMIKAQNARLACAKKAVAQAKKIFAAAVAYNPKKENYELYTAVGESAEFEAMMELA